MNNAAEPPACSLRCDSNLCCDGCLMVCVFGFYTFAYSVSTSSANVLPQKSSAYYTRQYLFSVYKYKDKDELHTLI